MLLEYGADTTQLHCGNHILFTAVEKITNIDIIKTLIEKGADINFRSNLATCSFFKLSPLFIAVNQGCYSVITTLLEYGANPNLKLKNKTSPLHSTMDATLDKPNIANVLIAYGAGINAQDRWGNTPLHYATSIEKIELLLDEGAKTTIRNKKYQLPLQRSVVNFKQINKGNEEAVNTLEEVINKYNEKPRSLTLLTRCCIRDRLIKSTNASTTETFKQKTAKLSLPWTLKLYIESASMWA